MRQRLRDVGRALRRQRRIVALFVFMVVLPSVVLGTFGLRALEADRYRIERLMQREQEEALRQARGSLQERFDALVEDLATVAGAVDDDAGNRRWERARTALEELEPGAPVPGRVALLAGDGTFLFVREGYLVRGQFDDPRASPEGRLLLEAERLEFASDAPSRAAEAYGRLAEAADPGLRSQALIGLARALRRAGRSREALVAYRSAATDWPAVLDQQRATHALIAALGMAELASRTRPTDELLGDVVGAYRRLVRDRWVVSPSTASFYTEELERVFDGLCGEGGAEAERAGPGDAPVQTPCDEFESLRASRAERHRAIERLDLTRRRLQRALGPWSAADLPSQQLVFRFPEDGRLVIAARAAASGAREAGEEARRTAPLVSATVVDDEELLAALLARSEGPLTRQPGVHIRVLAAGRPLHSTAPAPAAPAADEETSTTQSELDAGLPDWSLTAFHDPTEAALISPGNFYVGLTLLLASVLLLGVFVTAAAVYRELEAIRRKTDFVSIVSHEFKNPIASIRTLVERMYSGRVRSGEKLEQYLKVMSGELQRLTRLVNNVLDFSRIESGDKRYRLVPTDLAQLLDDLLAQFGPRASQQGFTIETDIDADVPPVEADPDAISQAVLNLLDNAMKYSADSRRIGVGLECNGRVMRLRVVDWGEGIAARDLEHVFERSYRAAASERRGVPGAGLGLSVVRHVVEGHGGRIEVDSVPGSGSTFTLYLPLDGRDDEGQSEKGRCEEGQREEGLGDEGRGDGRNDALDEAAEGESARQWARAAVEATPTDIPGTEG